MVNHWSDERRGNGGKPTPSLRVVAQIKPYFVLALDSGAATVFGRGLVWLDLRSQRHPPQ